MYFFYFLNCVIKTSVGLHLLGLVVRICDLCCMKSSNGFRVDSVVH